MTAVPEFYGEFWIDPDDEFNQVVGESLSPRGPEMLFDLFGELGIRPGELVLDIGGRDAIHSIELVQRFDVRALMIDHVARHLELAADRIKESGLAGRVMTDLGEIERIPMGAGSVDHIWCRDALNYVDVMRGLTECSRVLTRGGGMLVHQTFATRTLEPIEGRRLLNGLAINYESMDAENFEQLARRSGFVVVKAEIVDSEWRERWAESGESSLAEDLLALARMRRSKDALVQHYGSPTFEAMYGRYLWGIYLMLGKLQPIAYLLRKQD